MATQRFKKNPRTDVDVNLLHARFTDMLPDGRVIMHEDVEATIREDRKSAHYKTVTHHWRRALFNEQQLFLDGVSAQGLGFKVLTPDEMIRWSNGKIREAGRKLKKAIAVAASPSDDQLRDPSVRLWRARLLSAAEQMSTTHGRLLREVTTALRAPAQLPRPAEPAQ